MSIYEIEVKSEPGDSQSETDWIYEKLEDIIEETITPTPPKRTPKKTTTKTKNCPKCKKSFVKEQNRRDHMEFCVAKNEKSFICNICKNNYNHYSNLKRHKLKCIQENVERKGLIFSDKLNTLTVDKKEFESLWNKADKTKRDFFDYFQRQHEDTQKRIRPYFIYALVDPRSWEKYGSEEDQWVSFLKSIFFIGIGHAQNQLDTLATALQIYRSEDPSQIVSINTSFTDKDYNILEIWKEERGVMMPVLYPINIPLADAEAQTIEACLIKALGIENLTNSDEGTLCGPATMWSDSQLECFGVIHLYEMYMITRTSVEIYPDYIDYILD